MNYAVIDKSTGEVLNCVAWDGDLGKWAPPAGTLAVRCQAAGRGDDWDDAAQKFYRVEILKSTDGDGNITFSRARVGAPFSPQPEGGRADQKERPVGWKPRALLELEQREAEQREAARLLAIDRMLGEIVAKAEEAAAVEAEKAAQEAKIAAAIEAQQREQEEQERFKAEQEYLAAAKLRAATDGVEGIEL